MNKSIDILDKDYAQWVQELCKRYRQSQIKATVKVNTEQLKYNWLLGYDIAKAMFYVLQNLENGWNRSMLLKFISTDMYEGQG